jgi:hypothetical protein
MADKQTLQQFGAAIKAKHPEYKDMDDEAVGKAVLAKYPQYGDMVQGAPPSTDPSGRTPTGEAAPGDERNGAQRYLDNLLTPDPRREEWQSPLRNDIDAGARAAAGMVVPLISHPVKSAMSMGKEIIDPSSPFGAVGDMVGSLSHQVSDAYHQGGVGRAAATVGGDLAGAAATGALGNAGGKLLTSGVKALSEPMQAGGGGLIDRAAGSLKSDFAHGAKPGRAYLEGGGTPAMTMRGLGEKAEAVKNTAGEKLGQAYDDASQPAAAQPVRGLLQAPQYDVPLADSPVMRGRLSKPIVVQGNRAMPREFPAYGANPPAQAPLLGDTPGEGVIPDETEPWGERFNGMRFNENIGERGGTFGGGGQPQGVLRTRNPESAGQVMSPEEPGTPFPAGATRIGAEDVRSALLDPVNRLRTIQSGPGGVGASPLLDEYESGIRGATGQDFTPRSLFDLKRNVAANTRWNDPTMFDMNSVRQQGVGGVGNLLTEAVPETRPLNRIYQGAGNLADRATLRADTGSPPFTSLVNRGLEGAAGVGLGYMTHNPFVAAAPLLMDSVPVKTSAGYMLYQGGRLAGNAPNFGPVGAAAPLLSQGAQ